MKKVFSILMMLLGVLGLGVFSEVNVSAADYKEEAATYSYFKEDVQVLKFSYDYKTQFNQQGGYYNGVELKDNGNSLKNQWFYSAYEMTFAIDHYDKMLWLVDDDDQVNIRKYSNIKENFSEIVATYVNESGTYTLDTEGIYKIEYVFEGEIENYCYVYITQKLHDFRIKPYDSYLESGTVYQNFYFILNITDNYNLKDNKYYYAFGNDENALDYVEINANKIFLYEELISSNPVKSIANRKVVVNIKEQDVTNEGETKFLFIKVVKDGKTRSVQKSVASYSLFKGIPANVSFLNEEEMPITDKVFLKNGDIKQILLEFPIPVRGLRFRISLDGVEGNFTYVITSETEFITSTKVTYEVADGLDGATSEQFKCMDGGCSAFFGDLEEEQASISFNFKTDYEIDITEPTFSISGDSYENIQNKFDLTIEAKDENLSSIEYYVMECDSFVDGKCSYKGGYDPADKKVYFIGEVGEEVIEEYINEEGLFSYQILLNEEVVGSVDGKHFMLHILVKDKAGNSLYKPSNGYVVDNVIVNELESVLDEQNILEEEKVVGKKLNIKNVEDYKISFVGYRHEGQEEFSECVLSEDKKVYECLQVNGYYFVSDMEIKLADEYGNEEVYEYLFKYNDLIPTVVTIDGYTVNVYNDKEYDAEVIDVKNYMGVEGQKLLFDGEFISKLDEAINLKDKEDLAKKLVFVSSSGEVVLVEEVLEELSMPTTMEIMSKINSNEMFAKCALKDEICEIDLYLQYNYLIDGVTQKRTVKFALLDNTIKFEIVGFEASREIEVFTSVDLYEYKFYNELKAEVEFDKNIAILRTITFTDSVGKISFVNDIDMGKIGTYIITDQLSHGSDVSFPLTYQILVKDSEAPTLVLDGEEKIVIKKGQKLEDILLGIKFYDNYDTNGEIFYEIDEAFDENTVGEYTVRYWTFDSSGNKSNEITRTIVVESNINITTYLIIGGIGLFVVLVIVCGIIVERKKESRKS